MKRSHLFVLFLAILVVATAACGGTAAPAAPVENTVGDMVINGDPVAPPDFKNNPNLTANIDQDLGHVRIPAGLDPAGCLDANPLIKKGLQMAISGYAAQGGQVPQRYQQLCLDPSVASYVHNSGIQTLALSLRGETLYVFVDGLKLGTLERAGVERALEFGSNVNFVPADAVDAVAFVFEAADAFGIIDFDLFLYSWRYTYAHESGDDRIVYEGEIVTKEVMGTIDMTAVVTPTTTITGTITTITTVYPAGMVIEESKPITVESDERVAVEWPPLTRQAEIDAAAQAELAEQAAVDDGCWVRVASGDGPHTTTDRVAAEVGMTADQKAILLAELTAEHASGRWAAEMTIPVSCPEETPGPTGRELGGSQPQAEFAYIIEGGPLEGEKPVDAARRLAPQGGFDQGCLQHWFEDGKAKGLFAPGLPLPLPAFCLAAGN